MCIIIHAPHGRIPHEHLRNSLDANRDGWGYIFPSDTTLVVRKGLTRSSFWNAWHGDKQLRAGRPIVFHARISTSGLVNLTNCHPFKVPRRSEWIAHNGVLFDHVVKDSKRNDTQHFISDIVAKLPHTWSRNPAMVRLVETYLEYSKLAIMRGDGTVTILNRSLGYEAQGVWYSNTSYLPYTPYKAPAAVTSPTLAYPLAPTKEQRDADDFHENWIWSYSLQRYVPIDYSDPPPVAHGEPYKRTIPLLGAYRGENPTSKGGDTP
jgi:hypothetical protein